MVHIFRSRMAWPFLESTGTLTGSLDCFSCILTTWTWFQFFLSHKATHSSRVRAAAQTPTEHTRPERKQLTQSRPSESSLCYYHDRPFWIYLWMLASEVSKRLTLKWNAYRDQNVWLSHVHFSELIFQQQIKLLHFQSNKWFSLMPQRRPWLLI